MIDLAALVVGRPPPRHLGWLLSNQECKGRDLGQMFPQKRFGGQQYLGYRTTRDENDEGCFEKARLGGHGRVIWHKRAPG